MAQGNRKKSLNSARPLVGIVMGSDSDLPIMQEAAKVLGEFKIPYEITISSAHRSPDLTAAYARNAARRGIELIIAGAGGAAHLAGVIASKTILPVIGVPMDSSSLKGIDALLSTVQMPSGVPVATMALGKTGAKNAALCAVQILSLKYPALKKKLHSFKKRLARETVQKASRLRTQ
jgi:phosphoribosylaminoimidazole carboxylase PurE protein